MGAQYPEYPPNYEVVRKVGGMHRICLIIELLTDELLPARVPQIVDTLCMALGKFPDIRRADIIGEQRFTTPLLRALRLPVPPQESSDQL